MRLLVSTRKALVVLEQQGGVWTQVEEHFAGIPVTFTLEDPRTGTLFAALDHGHWGQKLHRRRPGEDWEELAAPAFAKERGVSVENLWCLAHGTPEQPGRLWAGTNPGALFRSDDDGDTWVLVDSLWDHPHREGWFGGGRDTPGTHSILVDPADPNRLLIGISCGGVYESCDDGGRWTVRNAGLHADFLPTPDAEVGHDPHSLSWCTSSPEVVWQQNHCGVFVSRDRGCTWTDVSGESAHFGFAIVADPDNPEVAWTVPAVGDHARHAIGGALQVCRTDDGGASWRSLTEGLPQRFAYDLVFRHAFALQGTALAFGSTTGNLFVSTDRGERWSCPMHHLPPIYAVTFSGQGSG